MSHTPGPWYTEGVGGIQMDGFRDGYHISSEDVRKVASTYPYGSKDRKQRYADACLIAAAPDLLAFIRKPYPIEAYDKWREAGDAASAEALDMYEDDRRALIAKAEGG